MSKTGNPALDLLSDQQAQGGTEREKEGGGSGGRERGQGWGEEEREGEGRRGMRLVLNSYLYKNELL